VGPPLKDVLRGRAPRGSARGYYFMNGFVRGLLTPLDHAHLIFRKPNEP
jgi:hypothetical protein